jgi:hypothetical protein
MTRVLVFVLLLAVLFSGSSCAHLDRSQSTANVSLMNEAVALGIAAVGNQSHYPKQGYTVVSAQQRFHKGKYIWLVVFKPAKLLPKDPSKECIGLGGEVIVNVDLSTKETVVTYGE